MTTPIDPSKINPSPMQPLQPPVSPNQSDQDKFRLAYEQADSSQPVDSSQGATTEQTGGPLGSSGTLSTEDKQSYMQEMEDQLLQSILDKENKKIQSDIVEDK